MNMNAIALTRSKPLSCSLGVSIAFHVLLVLILARNFLFQSVPPLLNESQTQFRIIPKKLSPPIIKETVEELKETIPTPAIKQIVQETPFKEPVPVTQTLAQPITLPVKIKDSLTPTIATIPIAIVQQSVTPIVAHASSRAHVFESPAVSMMDSTMHRARPTNVVSPRQSGRKALVQGGASIALSNKLNASPLQPRVLSANVARQAVVIPSLASVKVFTLDSTPSRVATLNESKGKARSVILQSSASSFISPELRPFAQTQLTDRNALTGFLQGIQKVIASAKRYPEEERQALHTGRMKVAFTLIRNGEIKNLRLKEKSEYSLLNQAALDAVSQVAPFSSFPAGIMEDSIDVVIPFRFDLR
jgi:TonB family protein